MSGLLDSIARNALFTLDPETAHGLSIKALKSGLVPGCRRPNNRSRLSSKSPGWPFPIRWEWPQALTRTPRSPNEHWQSWGSVCRESGR
jgi:hypothetical protein